MGEPLKTPKTPMLDLHNIFFMPKTVSLKEIGRVYKSLVTKKHSDKSSRNKEKHSEDSAATPTGSGINRRHHGDEDDDDLFTSPAILSRDASRRSKTPTPTRSYLSKNPSRRSKTPNPVSRSASTSFVSESESSGNVSRRRGTSIVEPSSTADSLPRSRSRARHFASEPQTQSPASVASPSRDTGTNRSLVNDIPTSSLSRDTNRRSTTPVMLASPSRDAGSNRSSVNDIPMASLSRDTSRRFTAPIMLASPSRDAGTNRSSANDIPAASLSRDMSRRATTPIIFSQSTVKRKPMPIEKTLECTLEDLYFGCVKKIRITRDVIKPPGVILQEDEVLQIEVKPGWRKGTKITFEDKGNEEPGYLPANIIFSIEEKEHPLFTRDGNDLEVCVEIPLVNALTGCLISVPLIGGETMDVSFENIVIYPGYVKVLKGKGMPDPQQNGRRGNLHIKLLVDFPKTLSDEQKKKVVSILQDCM